MRHAEAQYAAGKLALYEKLIKPIRDQTEGCGQSLHPANGQLLVFATFELRHKLRLGWADRVLWV